MLSRYIKKRGGEGWGGEHVGTGPPIFRVGGLRTRAGTGRGTDLWAISRRRDNGKFGAIKGARSARMFFFFGIRRNVGMGRWGDRGGRRRGNGHRYRAAGNHFRMHRRILAARPVFPFPSRARIRVGAAAPPSPRLPARIQSPGPAPPPSEHGSVAAVYEAK